MKTLWKNIKRLGAVLTGPMCIVGFLLALQVGILLVLTLKFSQYFSWFYLICLLLSGAVVVKLINQNSQPEFKLSLVIPIMMFPIIGGLIYLLFSRHAMGPQTLKRWRAVQESEAEPIPPRPEGCTFPDKLRRYLAQEGFPLCRSSASQYFSLGDDMWKDILEHLEQAEHYIYMEYFIIERGKMWDAVLEILKRKVREGVDVRVIYDGMGCVSTLPRHYDRQLEEMGIRCCVFNPFIPVVTIRHNNRDHRKILSIDGKVAYTGGVNMADEYINERERFGHWKDGGVRLEGESAWEMTRCFLLMWKVITGEEELSLKALKPRFTEAQDDGYAIIHTNEPLGGTVARDVYLYMINGAKERLYIDTPYLVLDQSVKTAILLAARSGVDVRLFTPHIGDKWYVHPVSRSHYKELVENGVRIFEYSPGFLHTKAMVCDGRLAVVGSANLDFRSFYLQFELGALLWDSQAGHQLEQDFLETQKICMEVTRELVQKKGDRRFGNSFFRSLLKLFSPLM